MSIKYMEIKHQAIWIFLLQNHNTIFIYLKENQQALKLSTIKD